MSLLRCEWKRLFARRVTRLMVAIVLLLLVIIAVATAASSHRITDADRARAASLAQQQESNRQDGLRQCQAAVDAGLQKMAPGETCEGDFGNKPMDPEAFLPTPWTFRTDAPNDALVFGGLFAMFAFLVGASFVGAEWTSGGMMNLLLWRPKRLSVLTTKLIGLATGLAAIGVVLGAIWAGLLSAIASTRGVWGHVTSGFLQSLGLAGARALALGVLAGLIGFAVASLGRHTAAALGAVVGYAIVWELGFRIVANSASSQIARPERFLLSHYAAAWMLKGYRVGTGSWTCPATGGECVQHVWRMTMGSAAEVGGVLLAIVAFWAFWSIRRRDVA